MHSGKLYIYATICRLQNYIQYKRTLSSLVNLTLLCDKTSCL